MKEVYRFIVDAIFHSHTKLLERINQCGFNPSESGKWGCIPNSVGLYSRFSRLIIGLIFYLFLIGGGLSMCQTVQADTPPALSVDSVVSSSSGKTMQATTPPTFRNLRLLRDLPSFTGVQVEPVTQRMLENQLTVSGTLDFNQDRYYTISVRHHGIIHQVLRTVGDTVQKGDPLVILESMDLAAQQQDFIDSYQMITNSKANRSQLRQSFAHQEQQVKENRKVYALTEDKYAEAEAMLEAARTRYENTVHQTQLARQKIKNQEAIDQTLHADRDRLEHLFEQDLVSEAELLRVQREQMVGAQQLHSLEQDYIQLKNETEARRLDMQRYAQQLRTYQQELSTLQMQLHQLKSQLTETQRQIFNSNYDVAIHENHYHKAHTNLTLLEFPHPERLIQKPTIDPLITIRSPVSGLIISRTANVGSRIQPEAALLSIADLSTLWVYLDVHERDFARFKQGDVVSIHALAFPEREFRGTIDFLGSKVESNSRTIPIRAVLDNTERILLPGMYVDVEHTSPTSDMALVIPSDAAIPLGKDFLVFVQIESKVYEPRLVQLGETMDGFQEVIYGLKEGERVVSQATFLFDSETQLRGIISDVSQFTD
jgi:RND family efflux transporter MFP subunit